MLTFIAKRSPVVRFLAKKTRPKAPRLIGLIISKSSIVVRSLEGCMGLVLKLRMTSSSNGASSSITVLLISTFSSSTISQSCKYFSLKNITSSYLYEALDHNICFIRLLNKTLKSWLLSTICCHVLLWQKESYFKKFNTCFKKQFSALKFLYFSPACNPTMQHAS